jgi:phosphoribosylanthranilate isomerase
LRVKICGLKTYTDAELALRLGATELGFIFAKSPRMIDVLDAKLICRNLAQSAATIGVFKDETLKHLLEIADVVKLKGLQLHGSESPEFLETLKKERPALRLFKAIQVQGESLSSDPEDYKMCDAVIFDSVVSHFEDRRLTLDCRKLESFQGVMPFYLAGGITKENAKELITRYKPSGIDLSSGVESSPGHKDATLMRNLFSELKELL